MAAFKFTLLVFLCLITSVVLEKILITGGAGFIGYHTAVQLVPDNTVVVLDNFDDSYDVKLKWRRAEKLKAEGVIVHSGDVCSQQMLDHLFQEHDFSVVIHLAGKEGASGSVSDPIGYITANTEGLMVLLEVLKDHKETRLVYASSYSVYGSEGGPTESFLSSANTPSSIYAALKIGTEDLVSAYCYKYSFKAVGLRFFSVYGPWGRPDGDIYAMATLIDKGEQVYVYRNNDDIVASRDHVYVGDAVNGIALSINHTPKDNCNEIFDIGSGQKPVFMDTVFMLLTDAMTKKAQPVNYIELPPFEPLVTGVNVTRSREILGYKPKTDIETGIRKFLEWYEDYHHDDKKWFGTKSPAKPDAKLSDVLYEKRIDYVNKKYHDRLAKMRLKYQHYAEDHGIPVTKLFRPKKFLEFPNKRPTGNGQRVRSDLGIKELESLCQDIDECVAFDTDGRMFSHIGFEKDWMSFEGTAYVADIDICQAGLTTCYGNCTCSSTGPSQAKLGCEKGFGPAKVDSKLFCIELYSPDRHTQKEEEFKILDKFENRDWHALIKDKPYILFKNTNPPFGTIAVYPDAAGDVDKLTAACNNTYHCIGFTTNGELKGVISNSWKSSKWDLYIRDFDYCSFGYTRCNCRRIEPGKYECTKH